METISLNKIKGIKDKLYYKFKQNNLWSTYDLFLLDVAKYDDFILSDYNQFKHNQAVCIYGTIQSEVKTFKKKITMTGFKIGLNDRLIEVICFNQPYLSFELKKDQGVIIKGIYNLFKNQIVAKYVTTNLVQQKIKPRYNLKGISDYIVSKALKEIISTNAVEVYETIPFKFLHKNQLISRKDAHIFKHFPSDENDLNQALRRFKYEEALDLQLKYQYLYFPKKLREPINYDNQFVRELIKKIGFELTDEQKTVVNQIFTNFKMAKSTYRLVQGDVGSGKTIVSFIAALGVISANMQVCFLAPTVILANQQYQSFKEKFKEIKCAFLSSQTAVDKQTKEQIENGEIQIIFGTHILASDSIKYKKLGLIIIDEQQRFGVNLRDKLIKRSENPDVLYLTATPIPRTLQLGFFANLDLSLIKTKPNQGVSVDTHILKNDINLIIPYLYKQVEDKNQTFIVTPSINMETSSIESTYQAIIKEDFKNHIYVIHGQQSQIENEYQIKSFLQDESGILLSTQMIEVGIDCKNATKIFIVASQNFGLSSLHQLRGRVGRGTKKGDCYLLSDKIDHERLNILVKTNSGFELSNFDLKSRGPGSIISSKQSGFEQLKYLDFSSDLDIIISAKDDASIILDNLKEYEYIKNKLEKLKDTN